ncbi:hypothetical protein TELCIR_01268 [Teladorsagia circumcincta]|uniref:Uncharacterized protein n=1 Tax=Teladorsagia circumcincta TaxID=45464 RepID=A0A2G9V3X4_TELCI|nr:hypothetical protein TELCIR_01268 [Teladorsagia circumcincta]
MASSAVGTGGPMVTKPPPIVENHSLQTLHPADQQWVATHQQSPTQPVQVRRLITCGNSSTLGCLGSQIDG